MAELDYARMPFSLEAEQSVLGAVLIDPECITEVATLLVPEDFYVAQNIAIFDAMIQMFNLHQEIDLVTVLDRLRRDGIFDEDRGKEYIVELADFVPTTANVVKYAEIVKEKSTLRQLIQAAKEISDSCFEAAGEVTDILDLAEQRVYDIANGKSNQDFVPISKAVLAAYDRLAALSLGDKSQFAGVPTHFYELDRLVGGLSKTDLIILAARPGVGKTSLALNIAENVAIFEKKKVCIFSLEMSKEQLATRMLASQSKVDSRRMMSGTINETEWPRLAEAASVLSATEIKIDDTPGVKITEMKAKLRREKDVGLVIIDYLQLMETGGRGDNRVNEISILTRQLKIMAKELNVPIICLSQLSRSTEKRAGNHRPMLSDLRDSGSIEQDADIVLFIYRGENYDDVEEEDKVNEIIVAKNRHGATGNVEVVWAGEYTKFMNLERRNENG